MNITLFNKNYWIRRFGETTYVRGYATTKHSDFVASMNVHPMSTNQLQALPEGERMIKRLQAESSDVIRASDQDQGIKGDLLYYHGAWYECTSAVEWDHTILSHWNYQFVIVPKDSAGTIDLGEPKGDPNDYAGGEDG